MKLLQRDPVTTPARASATSGIDALVRIDDSAETAAMRGWIIVAVFFGLLGSWLAIVPLNGAVVAPAVVKVDGNRKAIQHLEGGIVRRLHVAEGDLVAGGDTLVVLDDTQARSELDVLDQLGTVLLMTEARLTAEQEDREQVQWPATLAARRSEAHAVATWRSQQSQLETRRRESEGQSEIIRQRIAQLEAQIGGAAARSAALRSQHASVKQELASLAPLLEQGIVTRTRLLQLERSLAQLDGQIGEITGSIGRSEQAVGEQRQLELQGRNQRASAIAQELRDVQMRLAEVLPKLASARAVVERTVVRSPYRGRVVALNVFAVGAVVGRGERLMDIVPDEGALIVEARLAVEDVSDVHARAPAEVRLTGAKLSKTATLRAEVVSVSADRLTDPHSGAPYYAALIRIPDSELAAYPELRLQPGMPATASVPTEARTALQYLIAPLSASFDRALKER